MDLPPLPDLTACLQLKTNPLALYSTLFTSRACVDYIMAGLELRLHGEGELLMIYW